MNARHPKAGAGDGGWGLSAAGIDLPPILLLMPASHTHAAGE
jgi:hypothetical protein